MLKLEGLRNVELGMEIYSPGEPPNLGLFRRALLKQLTSEGKKIASLDF